jgi:NitT/TauT family transport system ATP-binding protein
VSDTTTERQPSAAEPASTSPHIEAREVYLGYPGTTKHAPVLACEDVNVSIPRGEFVVIVGPSGCGKSTFLEALAGLVDVGAGEIRVGGTAIHGPARDRALVFQSASLFPWRNVYDNVVFGLQAQGRLNKAGRERADAIIDLIGLSEWKDRRPRELSGGMRQRVNLARALVTEPSLLLLDEPFGALDAQTREVLQDELVRIWQYSPVGAETTAVFVTHDVREAVLLADRVLVFSKGPGRIVSDIRIDLPRPRTSDVRRSSQFAALEQQVLDELFGRPGAVDEAKEQDTTRTIGRW